MSSNLAKGAHIVPQQVPERILSGHQKTLRVVGQRESMGYSEKPAESQATLDVEDRERGHGIGHARTRCSGGAGQNRNPQAAGPWATIPVPGQQERRQQHEHPAKVVASGERLALATGSGEGELWENTVAGIGLLWAVPSMNRASSSIFRITEASGKTERLHASLVSVVPAGRLQGAAVNGASLGVHPVGEDACLICSADTCH